MSLDSLKKEIPFKWRIKSYSKDGKKGQCLAYIDARDVMDVLDDNNLQWSDSYRVLCLNSHAVECTLTVDGVTKVDVGYPNSDMSKEPLKDAYSDSLKRAAVKFGIGRFLYDMDAVWVDINNKQPVDKQGKRIWDLTKYINDLKGGSSVREVVNKEVLSQEKLEEMIKYIQEGHGDLVKKKMSAYEIPRLMAERLEYEFNNVKK